MHVQKSSSLPKHPTLRPVEPRTIVQAMNDAGWREAMSKEFNALVDNQTRTLVLKDSATNIIGNK